MDQYQTSWATKTNQSVKCINTWHCYKGDIVLIPTSYYQRLANDEANETPKRDAEEIKTVFRTVLGSFPLNKNIDSLTYCRGIRFSFWSDFVRISVIIYYQEMLVGHTIAQYNSSESTFNIRVLNRD